ncbi:MAG: hypothetical protein E7469_01830 [Ruminococcaceae bacterium]|nr:hypothetical protein [Oscillospiraceae bacterium]
MKKLISFLLAGILCLSLTACSGSAGDAKAPIPCEPMEQAAARDAAGNSTISVLISVNPQIKIFLDGAQNVIAIQCVNDDAKALFGGVDFAATQQDYPSLLRDILDRMLAQGYLTDGDELRFEIFGPTEAATAACSRTSRDVVQQLCEKEKITVTASCGGGLTAHLKLEGVKEVPLGPDVLEVKEDEDGNIVWVKSLDPSNGSVRESFYAPDGTLLHGVTHHPLGYATYLWFDENEKIINEYTADPGAEMTLDDAGNPVSAVYKDTSGNVTGRADFDGGVLIYEEKTLSDGRQVTSRYDAAGRLQHEVTVFSDGQQAERTLTYYANGNRKTQTDIGRTGLVTIWNYSEDGRTGTATYANGTVETEYYRADGSLEKVVQDSRNASPRDDKLYTETVYDSNQTVLTKYSLLEDGRKVYTTFHGSWDMMTTVFQYPNGGGHTEYWIGNTMIGGIDSDGNVWGDTFATYNGPVTGGTVGVG